MTKTKLIFNLLLGVTVCFSVDADVFQGMGAQGQNPAKMKEQFIYEDKVIKEAYDQQYIEAVLLPQIRTMNSHDAYKTYESFIKEVGTGYKLGMDLNDYWQMVWAPEAVKHGLNAPIPYELPARLATKEAYDQQYIEAVLLPAIQKISGHEAYLRYEAFVANEGTGYKPGMDINQYWKTVWAGQGVDLEKEYKLPAHLMTKEMHEREYVETVLLPAIQKISGHEAYLRYEAFVANEGTGYKPGMDINQYWKTVWAGQGVDLEKEYKLPAHLVENAPVIPPPPAAGKAPPPPPKFPGNFGSPGKPAGGRKVNINKGNSSSNSSPQKPRAQKERADGALGDKLEKIRKGVDDGDDNFNVFLEFREMLEQHNQALDELRTQVLKRGILEEKLDEQPDIVALKDQQNQQLTDLKDELSIRIERELKDAQRAKIAQKEKQLQDATKALELEKGKKAVAQQGFDAANAELSVIPKPTVTKSLRFGDPRIAKEKKEQDDYKKKTAPIQKRISDFSKAIQNAQLAIKQLENEIAALERNLDMPQANQVNPEVVQQKPEPAQPSPGRKIFKPAAVEGNQESMEEQIRKNSLKKVEPNQPAPQQPGKKAESAESKMLAGVNENIDKFRKEREKQEKADAEAKKAKGGNESEDDDGWDDDGWDGN